jgi:hypothetical protein
LKGIQLSRPLAEIASPIVSFGAGSLKFHSVINNDKRLTKPFARTALKAWLLSFDLLERSYPVPGS